MPPAVLRVYPWAPSSNQPARSSASAKRGRRTHGSTPALATCTAAWPSSPTNCETAANATNCWSSQAAQGPAGGLHRVADPRRQRSCLLGRAHRPQADHRHLRSAPIDVAPALRQHLFGCRTSVVCTSATLAMGGSIEPFAARIGADEARAVAVKSPFDFDPPDAGVRRVRCAPADSPKDAKFAIETLTDYIRFCTEPVRGGSLVLFTSYTDMRAVAAALEPGWRAAGRPFLMQGADLSRTEFASQMRRSATPSFSAPTVSGPAWTSRARHCRRSSSPACPSIRPPTRSPRPAASTSATPAATPSTNSPCPTPSSSSVRASAVSSAINRPRDGHDPRHAGAGQGLRTRIPRFFAHAGLRAHGSGQSRPCF
jgi:hypothetical protein